MTKYHLSKISGVPKTTIIDICSGKSDIQKCSTKTVHQLAKALECTMEDIMAMSCACNEIGLPKEKSYLELDFPSFYRNPSAQ